MAITHSTAVRSALADLIDDKVNTGSGTAKLRIRNSSNTTLVDFNLSNPAFGAASSGVITGASLPKTANAAATGTAANFQLLDRDGTEILSGTVSASGGGGDIIISNTSIASGQSCSLDTLTYTAPT